MTDSYSDTPAAKAPSASLWLALKDAIRGTNADYTRIPLGRAIFLLAIPMMLELVMESTFAVVDIYFVGKLGASRRHRGPHRNLSVPALFHRHGPVHCCNRHRRAPDR